ncbi:hypothetical protein D3H64_05310 [Atopobacter sp. AH10]|uniref:hypothetical protein n=1 Tax=Atopobacter sp. AH10 TaxID=2315861 RepID=UPI000EF25EC0|nr:hypothetical protein [Atopobacter sp. AH10]RLK63203.1 hypothetical protein D3H64_05310 [Atopobacter sp. AH10]
MKRKVINTAVLVFLIMSLVIILSYRQCQKPFIEAQKQGLSILTKKHKIEAIKSFYWFNGKKSYGTFVAKSKKEGYFYSIIDLQNKKERIFKQKDLIDEKEAKEITMNDLSLKAEAIKEARLGLNDSEPVWEINYLYKGKMGYYYISAKTGEWQKNISNI